MSENCIGYEIKVIETEPESEEARLARLEYKKKRCETQKASKKKRFMQTGVKAVQVYCHVDVVDKVRTFARSLTEVILEKQRKELESRPPETQSETREIES